MIKEEKIKVKIVGRTVKKYNNIGYECKVGDEIYINIEDLPEQSHVNITAICDMCNAERKLSLYAYKKNYKKYNYYCCNKCKQEKIEKTNQKKYGVKRPIQNKNIREKLENTCMEKYGVKVSSKNKEVIKKLINTNKKKYGVISTAKLDNIKEKKKLTKQEKILKKYKSLNILNINNGVCEFKCNNGHNFIISFSNLHNRLKYNVNLCTVCNPIDKHNSNKENQLLEFIKNNYNGEIVISNREILNGKELDIYLPELKLAFEFNGLYWHSELYKYKNYHLEKTEKCLEKGIQLIHVWEDDWNYKQEIIKSMILNKLGKTTKKIFGRKTEVKVIKDNNLVRTFLDENHIQGFVGSSIKLGLFYNNELVSLMTFKKRKEKIYELNRFCNKTNTNIVGGFSKLLKYFEINYKYTEIISFARLDYSYGKVYNKYFNFVEKLKPDYSYIIDGIRKHKFNFRMKNEKDFMFNNGYYKIYNCGLLKYQLSI